MHTCILFYLHFTCRFSLLVFIIIIPRLFKINIRTSASSTTTS